MYEIRSIVYVETYNLILQTSMTIPKQQESCYKNYDGQSEIMGQAEKFLKRMSVYSNMWVAEQSKSDPHSVSQKDCTNNMERS